MFIKVSLQFFAEEENPQPTQDPTPEEVLDIKTNYVKKSDYEKVQEDYRKLVNSVLEGGDLPAAKNPNGEEGVDKDKLRKELYDPNGSLSNLEYVEKTLKLREQIMKDGGKDPFLPTGIKGNPYQNDQEQANAEATAEKVAKVLGEAIKEANGDPEAFDVIMTKIIK
jgi:hypothetical protein